ncbi:hypothetical protein RJ641_026869 [Dillenia turbinata]|uniref:Uncharacterized protein n=1 Tax=Dillenia turbinata TaxID=194707 RepID=A0AAN8ZL50_9MAGN
MFIHVIGTDVDSESLEIALQDAEDLEVDIDLLRYLIKNLGWTGQVVDTLVMNLSFGTHRKGADMDFLSVALKIFGNAICSFKIEYLVILLLKQFIHCIRQLQANEIISSGNFSKLATWNALSWSTFTLYCDKKATLTPVEVLEYVVTSLLLLNAGQVVDTVVLNPPFGTCRKGADMNFLSVALEVVDTVVMNPPFGTCRKGAGMDFLSVA